MAKKKCKKKDKQGKNPSLRTGIFHFYVKTDFNEICLSSYLFPSSQLPNLQLEKAELPRKSAMEKPLPRIGPDHRSEGVYFI